MIIHIDLDCYFVSAERTLDKSLMGRPVVVGNRGDSAIFAHEKKETFAFRENRGAFSGASYYDKFSGGREWQRYFVENGRIRGMVVTASYEARKFGVRKVMSLREALEICPELIIRPARMRLYYELSSRLYEYLQTRIPLLEQSGIDEFFGDLKGWVSDGDTGDFIKELQSEVMRKFDLPLSIGASYTRSFAKVATSSCKPYGTRVFSREGAGEFFRSMKIEDFPGIGRSMQKKFKGYGIRYVHEIKEMEELMAGMGRMGREIFALVSGRGDDVIKPFHTRKSVGIGRSFDPIVDRMEFARRCVVLSRHLAYTIAKLGVNPTTFFFKIRYENGMKSKVSFSQNRLFSEKLFKDMALKTLKGLDVCKDEHIRYINMSASNFADSKTVYSLLEFEKDRKFGRLFEAGTKIRGRYGIDAIMWGSEKELF